jgi:hypothetical protein
MALRGRPRVERDPNERVPMSTRIRGELFNELSKTAAENDRPLGNEIEQRLEESLPDDRFPPEIAALTELVGRVMVEVGETISDTNAVAGHGFKPWLEDGYAYTQAIAAAVDVLMKTRTEEDGAPHGVFASEACPPELARRIGQQVASGVIAVMFGQHDKPGSSWTIWTSRIRRKLGVLGERLQRHPLPKGAGYFVARPRKSSK